jgi:hypothetical protein
MPLTSKGEKILEHMEETYGSERKAKSVLYASKNAGKISGIDQGGSMPTMPNVSVPPNSSNPATSTGSMGTTSPPPVTGDEGEEKKGPKGVLKPIGEMPEEKIKSNNPGGPSGTPDMAGRRKLAQDRPPDKAVGTLRDYAAAAGAKRPERP